MRCSIPCALGEWYTQVRLILAHLWPWLFSSSNTLTTYHATTMTRYVKALVVQITITPVIIPEKEISRITMN